MEFFVLFSNVELVIIVNFSVDHTSISTPFKFSHRLLSTYRVLESLYKYRYNFGVQRASFDNLELVMII